MRTVMNQAMILTMRMAYGEIEESLREGGYSYETPSAIWSYNPTRKRVSLYVKNPSSMTNTIIDYTPNSLHYDKHKDRILRLAS